MRAVAVELFKFRRQPLMRNLLLGALLLTVLGIVMYGIGTRVEPATGLNLANKDIQRQMFGTGAGNTIVAVVALLGITGEYRHGTITTTFLARPSRAKTIYSKLGAYSIVALVYGMAVAVLATGAGLAVLAISDVSLAVPWSELVTDFLKDLVGLAMYSAYGLAIGAVLANQVAGIIVILGELLIAEVVGFLSPTVGKFLPGQAAASMLSEQPPFARDALSAGEGALVFVAYVLIGVTAAVVLTRRRDIT